MRIPVPLLYPSGVRLHARSRSDLVSVRRASLRERPRMAVAADGSGRPVVPATGPQVRGPGEFCEGASPDGSAIARALAATVGSVVAVGPSGPPEVAGPLADRVLL